MEEPAMGIQRRKYFVGSGITLLALAAFCLGANVLVHAQTSPNIFQATLAEPSQKTPEISTEELRKVLSAKSATLFDARPFKEYAVSHIPGAVNVAAKPGVPMSLYVSDVAEIGRFVGSNRQCQLSSTATALSVARPSDSRRNYWPPVTPTSGGTNWGCPSGAHWAESP
ncbi:MAG: rhodanese-like domain-containing protein [Candidatus Acidiferrales bacterium]